ncbi:Hypothetical Protein FCC1311_102782 [Hondaea fermentalgiana]|uniref:Uncharacterized protein n=1 Tax=Hondaea fermentalgiana TaxID=2315210 RepID=A0A2R5GU22_9STRA|nr:Hypothetical Protein FCC1311_102782 [Hondaea fermentalgiana]|eukprot:GBG34055.1 Hypothetical Protein FCC1311_102782 [Hondaea fermentalgiana]
MLAPRLPSKNSLKGSLRYAKNHRFALLGIVCAIVLLWNVLNQRYDLKEWNPHPQGWTNSDKGYVLSGKRRNGEPPFRPDEEVLSTQPKYRMDRDFLRPPPVDKNGNRMGPPGIGQFPDTRIKAVIFEDGDQGREPFDGDNLINYQPTLGGSLVQSLRGKKKKQPERSEKESLVFLITGQLSRLELESKIVNVFEPQMERYDVDVLLFLKVFVKLESMSLPRWPSPYEITDWDDAYLKSWARDSVPGMIPESLRIEHVSEQRNGEPYTFRKIIHMEVRSRSSSGTMSWQIVLINKENDGLVVYPPELSDSSDWNAWMDAQQDTFRNFRKAMMFIEDMELQRGKYFDVVFRMRDDTFAFGPFLIPPDFDRDSFGTTQCGLSSYPNGYSDHNFILGRNIASKVLRGFAEDFYFRITEMYLFVENYLFRIINYVKPRKIMRIPDCSWPFFPILYADLGNGQWRMEFREFEISHVWRFRCPKKWHHWPSNPKQCAWIQPDFWLHSRTPALQAYLPLHIMEKDQVPDDVLETLEWYGRKWPIS